MPILRPFRALRFDAATTDLAAVLAPPYDIISPSERRALLAQDARNAVRVELPADVGSGDPEAYQAAARTVAEWRSTRVLVKDREPTVTILEMSWLEADGQLHACTGVMARLRLEEFGPGAGVLPHERTMRGPKEDRYQLLRATGLNTSPIVLLAGSDASAATEVLEQLMQREPDAAARTADGVSHRLWVIPTPDVGRPDDDRAAPPDEAAAPQERLLRLLASAPLTIADGHHRYETALRYRAERGARRACESDPPWDYVLALVYPLELSPPALPTHRVLRGKPCGEDLLARLGAWFRVERLPDQETLLAAMAQAVDFPDGTTGTGRIGLFTDGQAAMLDVDRGAVDPLLDASLSRPSRELDVHALNAVLGPVFGDDAAVLAADGRLWYVKDAREAVRQVDEREASACFLLYPMPQAAISRVAEAGDVMPHKSTYFEPKAPTGLLFSPLEW